MKTTDTRAAVLGDILSERERQVTAEKFDAEHDDCHIGGELAMAAALYAAPCPLLTHSGYPHAHVFSDPWPWRGKFDKRLKHGRRRQLVIAGALIVAEIERIDRYNKGRENDG